MPGRDYPLLSFEWITCFVYRSLSGWAVPVFVMISGALFLDPSKEVTIVKLFKNNILKLFIVLLFWSAFYTCFCHGDFFPLGLASGHLWYLSMILGLYLTIPIIRNMSNKIRDYFLIIWILFLSYDFIAKLFDICVLQEVEHLFFQGYVGYLLLGDWCRRQRNNSKLCVRFVVIATILLILSVGISLYISKLRNETFLSLGHYFSPITVFVSVGLYFACNMLSIKLTGLDKLQKYLRNISVCTLGIYLIHMFLLIQGYTRVVRFVSNPLIFLPLVVGGVFVLGWLITFVIRKIPYIGKYIV
jgi:surface polysaccharide O-acyltransferase-like enzyme